MAAEPRNFSGAELLELSPGCEYYNTFGQPNVMVRKDPANPGQFTVIMDSTAWPAQAGNYVAPAYPPVV